MLETVFAPFVKERPICVMARGALERLLDAQRLETLFACAAQHQYPREFLFSSLVQLMRDVVLGVHPTVPAAYQANNTALGVSTTALYNKLDRVETGVAAALVRDSAALADPVVKALRASHPRWVPGYHSKVLDGNPLSSTAHRLQAWRGTWAGPCPGHALVVLAPQRMLLTDVLLSEDGHAQERRLIAQVLHHVQADQLWSEDRHCCTLGLRCGMARRGPHSSSVSTARYRGNSAVVSRARAQGAVAWSMNHRCACVTPTAMRRCGSAHHAEAQGTDPRRRHCTAHALSCAGPTGIGSSTRLALRQTVDHRDRFV